MADELTGETIASLVAQERRPVAVTCHGPWTSVEAGVLEGRTVTSWPSLRTDIRDAGAPPPTPPAAVRSAGYRGGRCRRRASGRRAGAAAREIAAWAS